MSTEEDTELRDLVAQTLETNGVLGKIRAQLRASVFLALEEQESVKNKTPFMNHELKKFINTKEGRIVVNLVKEFLDFFNLEFTAAVFEPECGFIDEFEKRSDLARDLDIIESDKSTSQPLLAELLRRGSGDHRGRLGSGTENPGPASPRQTTIDTKNQKNNPSNRKLGNGTSTHNGDDFFDDELDDAFFDKPSSNSSINNNGLASSNKKKTTVTSDNNNRGMSSLAGLPALGSELNVSPRTATDRDMKAIDKKLGDLGLGIQDEYDDDDFESSNIQSGITPRSNKTDDQNGCSIQEDIDEEIDEDISIAEDLLKSDNSNIDDLTTDRTVSPTDQSAAFDYAEEVIGP